MKKTLYEHVINGIQASYYDDENDSRISLKAAREKINEMSMAELLEAISSSLEDLDSAS